MSEVHTTPCSACKKMIYIGAKFCPFCATSLPSTDSQQQASPTAPAASLPPAPQQPVGESLVESPREMPQETPDEKAEARPEKLLCAPPAPVKRLTPRNVGVGILLALLLVWGVAIVLSMGGFKFGAPAPAAADPEQPAVGPVAPLPHKGDTWRDPVTGMEFVWVSGGTYEMGCGFWTSDCGVFETPLHDVELRGFWLGNYDVTQGQWQKIMERNPSRYYKGDNYPVERVSWDDANTFIAKLNAQGGSKFRLPTEAEWEYAARSGGRPEKYAGVDELGRIAWYSGNSGGSTHEVGTRAPNGLGLYDMSGNVAEWCADGFSTYDHSPRDSSAAKAPPDNEHMVRGGSWRDAPEYVRAASRHYDKADSRVEYIGLRLARTN